MNSIKVKYSLLVVLFILAVFQVSAQAHLEFKRYAIIKFKNGDYTKALEYIADAVNSCKNSDLNEILVWQKLIIACNDNFNKAENYYAEASFDKAQLMYKKVLTKNPTDSVCLTRLTEIETLNFNGSVKPVYAGNIKVTIQPKVVNGNQVYNLVACFELSKNDYIAKGNYDIYYLITDPNGFIISKYENVFELHGLNANYTGKAEVTYQSANENSCIKYSLTEELILPGQYRMDLFMAGNHIGRTSFEVK